MVGCFLYYWCTVRAFEHLSFDDWRPRTRYLTLPSAQVLLKGVLYVIERAPLFVDIVPGLPGEITVMARHDAEPQRLLPFVTLASCQGFDLPDLSKTRDVLVTAKWTPPQYREAA